MRETRGEMRTVWAIALAVATFRLLLFHGLDLYSDEAYYWMWSRRPALGYFDHPPMVAWLVRGGTALLPGELGVRILFVACGALAVVFAGLVARELSDDPRAPAVGAALAATAPLLMLTGGLALPDAPVEAAYAGATWLIARARGRRWIAAGVLVGLALLSKYTAALLAPALLLLVLLDRELRDELRTPWPWLGGAVAVLVFLPNLLWNASHGWLSIVVQMRHGVGDGASVRTVLEFVGGLLGGAGLVALPLGVAALLSGRDSPRLRVAAATLVPLAVTVVSASRGKVEANWAALAYPALSGAAAAMLVRLRPAWAKGLLSFSVALGMVAAVAFGLEVRNPRLIPGDSEAVKRFRGWPEFAAQAKDAVRASCASIGTPPGCTPDDPFVYPSSYQDAAELAFYAGWTRFGPAAERPSQLDLWGDLPRPGEPFVALVDGVDERRLFRGAGEGKPVEVTVELAGTPIHQARLTAWREWLAPEPRRVNAIHWLKDLPTGRAQGR
jgi:4-amino-4-deoxy-L-arabinose transferase-like glycosyltransferase